MVFYRFQSGMKSLVLALKEKEEKKRMEDESNQGVMVKKQNFGTESFGQRKRGGKSSERDRLHRKEEKK